LTVFISHSFKNKPEFENVADWLDQVGAPYWHPTEVKSGDSLREQLRAAVGSCTVCIFVATLSSVQSSWCGAELGAFWGNGVPIIVYLAESSLPEDRLPPILQGDVWERNLSKVASRAKELDVTASESSRARSVSKSARVTNITVEQLEKLIAGTVALVVAGKESVPTGTSGEGLDSVSRDTASRLLRAADATSQLGESPNLDWQRHILWVDDQPENNSHERRTFESLGFRFTLSASTSEAQEELRRKRFGAIISDMGRREGPQEGYKLLEWVRSRDRSTPFFIYTGFRTPEHIREAADRGAQGLTNVPSALLDMVTQNISHDSDLTEDDPIHPT
jgi:CheY-like chemotaxis protein